MAEGIIWKAKMGGVRSRRARNEGREIGMASMALNTRAGAHASALPHAALPHAPRTRTCIPAHIALRKKKLRLPAPLLTSHLPASLHPPHCTCTMSAKRRNRRNINGIAKA